MFHSTKWEGIDAKKSLLYYFARFHIDERLRQLPRPKVRGLRLRKKSCRVWPVDLRVTNSQSFTGLPQLDSTCLTRRLNVVTWITKSKHPSSLLNIMPRETIDPRSQSFSGRSRVPTSSRRESVSWTCQGTERRLARNYI